MKAELEQYNLEELKSLKMDVETAIESFRSRALANAREELEKTAKSMGFKLEEIIEMRKPRAKVPPKYRNRDEPEQTWTGRGRKPKWVEKALNQGYTLQDLQI